MQQTVDLGELAQLKVGDRVEVERLGTKFSDDFYEQTIELLSTRRARQAIDRDLTKIVSTEPPVPSMPSGLKTRTEADTEIAGYVPDNEHLREVFLVAEAVGGYQQLHDLVYAYSPGLNLIEHVRESVARAPLRPLQVRDLTQYRDDIRTALRAAHRYVRDNGTGQFSNTDIKQLHALLVEV